MLQIYPVLVLLVLRLYINPFLVDGIAFKYVVDHAVNDTIAVVRVKNVISGSTAFENR